jgi:hypothetical protein
VSGLALSSAAFGEEPAVPVGVQTVVPEAGETGGPADPPSARLDIYGFAMLDAIYDINASHPDWKATLRPSTIPVVCPGDAGCGEDGTTTLSVRQSRFGTKSWMDTAAGDFTTIFEFELFGVGVDAGHTTFRLRHAWGELGHFGAGQTWSLFMDPDVFPNTIDYWGPVGMAFYRNAQMRVTAINNDEVKLAFAIEHPGSAIDAGKVGQIDPALGAGLTSWDQFPDVTAQFRFMGDWGHVQVSGIARVLGVQGPDDFSQQVFGWGGNLAGVVNIARDQLLLQVLYGEGIANYMNDGGTDLAPDVAPPGAEAVAVPTFGWLAYYNRTWSDHFTSSIGYTENRQTNTDGQTDGALKTIQYGSVNVLYSPVSDFFVGPEFAWGRRENKNGDDAMDMRVQVSAKYKFGATIGGDQG